MSHWTFKLACKYLLEVEYYNFKKIFFSPSAVISFKAGTGYEIPFLNVILMLIVFECVTFVPPSGKLRSIPEG